MNTLLYLVYGEAEEFQLELTFSVLTAVTRGGDHRDFRIVVASETHCDDLPVDHLPFSSEEFSDWTFGGRFGHGAKIGALRKAADLFGGKIALVDTDTFFLRSPAELFDRIDEGHAVMHHDEGPLARHGQCPTYRALMADYSGEYRFDQNAHMFNSGVVGISSEQAQLLDEAARMTKDLVDLAGPIHTLEQFSLGSVLGTQFDICIADDIVRHYTGWQRRFVHERTRERLPEGTKSAPDTVLAACRRIDEVPPRRAPDRLRARLKAWRRRGLDEYALAYLCYLSAFSARSRGEANAWAGTALDFIIWNQYPHEVVAADFSRMGPDRLGALDWLDPGVRHRWDSYWQEVTTTYPASQ